MFRRITAIAAVTVALGAGILAPTAATAATSAPCPTNNVCVYSGDNGEYLTAKTLAGWAGTKVDFLSKKIVNNTKQPISVTLSEFTSFEDAYFGQAQSRTIRVAPGATANVYSLDVKNIRATR